MKCNDTKRQQPSLDNRGDTAAAKQLLRLRWKDNGAKYTKGM